MSSISMASGTTRERATSCCFLRRQLDSVEGLRDAASDWEVSYATTIERQPNGLVKRLF